MSVITVKRGGNRFSETEIDDPPLAAFVRSLVREVMKSFLLLSQHYGTKMERIWRVRPREECETRVAGVAE